MLNTREVLVNKAINKGGKNKRYRWRTNNKNDALTDFLSGNFGVGCLSFFPDCFPFSSQTKIVTIRRMSLLPNMARTFTNTFDVHILLLTNNKNLSITYIYNMCSTQISLSTSLGRKKQSILYLAPDIDSILRGLFDVCDVIFIDEHI
eukprot:GEMP01105157.1.p1 GENE.GEMP01105157.1~~GEMP01105157.1.p1  ORF type:complete len:148 (-),score=0.21 GEMP01105157.1:213-656(-)